MWRCLNDPFGYCSGEPETGQAKEIKSGDLAVIAKKCKRDPLTCEKFQLLSEQLVGVEIPEGHLKTTVTPRKNKAKAEPEPEAVTGVML